MNLPTISLTCGNYVLNDGPNFNFQLNHVIPWNSGKLEDVTPRLPRDLHGGRLDDRFQSKGR